MDGRIGIIDTKIISSSRHWPMVETMGSSAKSFTFTALTKCQLVSGIDSESGLQVQLVLVLFFVGVKLTN